MDGGAPAHNRLAAYVKELDASTKVSIPGVPAAMSVRVLLITRHREPGVSPARAFSQPAGSALTIESVTRLSDAITRLKKNDIQAVMVDLNLPDAIGFEVLLALIGVAPHLPILVLSDGANVLQQMDAAEQTAAEYTVKPGQGAEMLMRTVHGAIGKKVATEIALRDNESEQLTLNFIVGLHHGRMH